MPNAAFVGHFITVVTCCQRDEVTGVWRKLRNEELDNLLSPPNIVRVIKIENEMSWACSADGGGERRVQGFGGET
jgi:hypothetical protein